MRHSIARLRRLAAGLHLGATRTGGAAALLTVAIVAGLLSQGVRFDFWQRGNSFDQRAFPIAAIEQLRPFPPGQRVFNDGSWGGYLIFCCAEQAPPFVDGRVDFYGAAYMADFYRTLNGEPGWREVLDRYQVDWVMVMPDRPLVPWLEQDPSWQRIYADATAVVFVRQPLPGGPAGAPVGNQR